MSANRWKILRALSSLPDHKVIRMPALSPTMEVGTIQEWKKKVGDEIEGGEVIAEIETDKATRSYEYNDDGYLARVSSDPDFCRFIHAMVYDFAQCSHQTNPKKRACEISERTYIF